MDALTPGRELGKYRVLRRLATGGMAEIYLAEARGIEGFAKPVVLKCILPQYAQSETFVRLFLNEARVTASLDHPNIAGVYDIGESAGMYFFAMEYLHGEDLGHVLRELCAREVMLPLEHALTIAAGVAAGLHAAHEKRGNDGRPLGIVHRDVSPSNVVITYDGGVKLVDFGVAKLTAEAELTRTGTLRGKVSYMSPEQCNNDPVDRRSDIFSLGILLYELTTLTRLFRADSEAATLRLVLATEVPPPSTRVAGYPPELEPVIMRALARDRDQRYATARELQLAIEEVARRRGLVTSAAGLGEWMVGFFGRRPEAWISLPGVAAVASESVARSPAEPSPAPVLDRGPVLAALPVDQEPAVDATPAPAVSARERPMLTRLLPLATLGAAFALTLGMVLRAPAPAPAPVVAAAPVVPPPPVMPPPAPVAEVVPPPTEPTPNRPVVKRPAAPVNPLDRFRRAFARKEAALLRCFARFGDRAGEAPAMWLRFQADEAGHVVKAELSPAELRETPLGLCLEEVARATEFGAQPAPVTFRIPVSVQRVGAPPRQ